MIRRCAAAGLPEPEFAVTDGFVTTIRRAALPGQAGHAEGQAEAKQSQAGAKQGHAEGQAGAKQGHAGAKQAMQGPSRAKWGAKQAKKRAKRYCQPKTPPCCEPAAGRPFLVKSCRQPLAIRAGRAISEDGWSDS